MAYQETAIAVRADASGSDTLVTEYRALRRRIHALDCADFGERFADLVLRRHALSRAIVDRTGGGWDQVDALAEVLRDLADPLGGDIVHSAALRMVDEMERLRELHRPTG